MEDVMIKYRTLLLLSGVGLGLTLFQPANAQSHFDCNGPTVPNRHNECLTKVISPGGEEPFSCGQARTPDQIVYCGAVYGYERNWCRHIHDQTLRSQCLADTALLSESQVSETPDGDE
jgi:hypothetical protein